jgi:hypothetical protein
VEVAHQAFFGLIGNRSVGAGVATYVSIIGSPLHRYRAFENDTNTTKLLI